MGYQSGQNARSTESMGEAANASAFVTNSTGSASMGTGPCFRSTGSIGIGSFSHAATYAFAGADATSIGIYGSTIFIPILSFTP